MPTRIGTNEIPKKNKMASATKPEQPDPETQKQKQARPGVPEQKFHESAQRAAWDPAGAYGRPHSPHPSSRSVGSPHQHIKEHTLIS